MRLAILSARNSLLVAGVTSRGRSSADGGEFAAALPLRLSAKSADARIKPACSVQATLVCKGARFPKIHRTPNCLWSYPSCITMCIGTYMQSPQRVSSIISCEVAMINQPHPTTITKCSVILLGVSSGVWGRNHSNAVVFSLGSWAEDLIHVPATRRQGRRCRLARRFPPAFAPPLLSYSAPPPTFSRDIARGSSDESRYYHGLHSIARSTQESGAPIEDSAALASKISGVWAAIGLAPAFGLTHKPYTIIGRNIAGNHEAGFPTALTSCYRPIYVLYDMLQRCLFTLHLHLQYGVCVKFPSTGCGCGYGFVAM